MQIDGRCHCGNVAYKAEVDPSRVVICHCTDCQTMASSAFRTSVFCEEENFRLITAPPKIYLKVAESGRLLAPSLEKARAESEWCIKPKHKGLLSIEAPPDCDRL